ncbi:MAG: hypothetical protein IJT38_01665 [Clostridia bacterium]|nr:hypothetical protein [Clostridia bacterium]
MYFAKPEDHFRIYGSEFVRDLRCAENSDAYPTVKRPADYSGQPVIRFAPSQLSGMSPHAQKKLTDEWAAFLTENKLPLTEVQVVTSLVQRVFDGLCMQDSIESLRIKWINCSDISRIRGLTGLKKLFIENGSRLTDISPIADLRYLDTLILGETVKVTDYSCLSALKRLKVFSVCSYQTFIHSRLTMNSAEFLRYMDQLEYVDILDVKQA